MGLDKRQALINYASSITDLKFISNKYNGCCPVHNDSDPSFWVYPDSGQAVCFSCGFKGDVFALYMDVTGEGFLDAKKALGFWESTNPSKHIRPNRILDYKPDLQWFLYESCIESVRFSRNLKIKINGTDYQALEYIYFCLTKMKSWRRGLIELYSELHKKEVRLFAIQYFYHKFEKKLTGRDRMRFFKLAVVNL
jgi:hypothetical protein